MPAQTSTPPAALPKPPPSRLEVTIGDEAKTLFMSFGLLNELTALVGGPEAVASLHFDPNLRTTALQLLLAKRDRNGKILNDEDDAIIPFDLDAAEAEKMTNWVADHCLDFFIRQFARSANLLGARAGDLAAIGSSLTSSPNSPGKTPSA